MRFFLKDRTNLVDKLARITMKKTQLSASAMTYYCGYNHYDERDKATHECASTDEHPRFSEIET